MAGRRAARRVRCRKCSESVYGFRAFGRVPLRHICRNVHSNKRRKSAAIRRFFCARWGRGLCFFTPLPAPVFARRRVAVYAVWGVCFFFLQSPYPQHFFHAPNPPFVKKFRAPERIGYQGTAIFAQPPPPPCRRARRRADNPADEPACNADNRIHRTRRSQTTACIGVRRTHAVHPTVGVGRTHAVHPVGKLAVRHRRRIYELGADCPPSVYRRHRRPSPPPTVRRTTRPRACRRRQRGESANRIVAVRTAEPHNPQYPSYIRVGGIGRLSIRRHRRACPRRENRRHLPNTQMFRYCNCMIINKHIRNIHHKTPNYIHLPANFAPNPDDRNPSTRRFFLPKNPRTSISLKLIITTEQSC